MTDIRKIPDAMVIAERIKAAIPSIHDLEMKLVTRILDDWNEEWIDYIAENKTGLSDGTENTNDNLVKNRINKLGRHGEMYVDDPGY